jgi:hypothetical protein
MKPENHSAAYGYFDSVVRSFKPETLLLYSSISCVVGKYQLSQVVLR